MPCYNDPENNHRPFWASLIYTKTGDLDLTWVLLFLITLVGLFGFVWTIVLCAKTVFGLSLAAWSFIGSIFAAMLIAAVPVAKAKILADAKLPADIGKTIGEAGKVIETSTDVQEISQKQKG